MEYEFNLKAYDKELKRMCDVIAIDKYTICVYNKEEDINSGWIKRKDRFVVLQPTGVKDIKENESYLGDILKEHLTEWSSKKDIEHANKCFCIVKKESNSNNMYLEYNFNIRGYWETNNLSISKVREYEIVGNIYENPEMIKKED